MKLFNHNEYDGEKFNGLVFEDEKIGGIEFYNSIFKNCSFLKTTIRKCVFNDCKFQKCNLKLVRPEESSFMNVVFENSVISGVNFSEIVGAYKELDFVSCKLTYVTILDLDLSSKNFSNSTFKDCNFFDVDFKKSNFSNVNLKGTEFQNCDLRESDFTGAKNYFINISANKIKGAKFSIPEAYSLLKNLDVEIVE